MLKHIRQSLENRDDKGFTLIELLVVVIIIGILASVAIPVFLGQRQRAHDAAVQSDMKSFATGAETYFASNLAYPTTATGFATNGTSIIKSEGTEYIAWVDTEGNDAGYVIYGRHENSDKVFVVSSYNGGAPVGSSGTALPTAAPSGAALTELGAPTSATFEPTAGLDW